ncbi:hypothetical protein PhCBS80983_g00995 [Powellomyces hirtus]|uniref:PA14 domain-containing protein n=1 Tax=Powellomyces hirtus TaxID=109895 RepID=A0A507ECB6_9FUNG|nr:hypothetical protein PhCBS80983_g00995 [Powellomyces hirtus]
MSPVQDVASDGIPDVRVQPDLVPDAEEATTLQKNPSADADSQRKINARHSWAPSPNSTVASAAEPEHLLGDSNRQRKTRSFSQASVSSETSRLSYFTIPGSVVGEDGHAPGAIFEYYKGEFGLLPDFNTLSSYSTGIAKSIHIDYKTESELFDKNLQKAPTTDVGNYAVRFTAQLKIPHPGQWTFYLGSNDGAALYISGRKVVDNDGSHYVVQKEGTIKIQKAGYYPITVCFFHRNGKMMEGVRTGASLDLSYYCPGSGWLPFPPDRVAKTLIPESAFFYNARDERIGRILESSNSLTWDDLPDAMESDQTRLRNLEQDLNDMSEKLMAVQKALVNERIQSQNMIKELAQLSLFGAPLKEDHLLLTDHSQGSDDLFEEMHKQQMQYVSKHIADVKRLKLGYFFSLGVTLKLSTKQNHFSVQDAYEQCMKEKIPIQEWSAFLRKAMHAAGQDPKDQQDVTSEA